MQARMVAVVAIVGSFAAGCATHRGWQLVHPPETADAAAPGGGRLFPSVSVDEWRVVDTFGDETECTTAVATALDENLARAHAAFGDDAKYDLGVRRAVNARCVPVPDP